MGSPESHSHSVDQVRRRRQILSPARRQNAFWARLVTQIRSRLTGVFLVGSGMAVSLAGCVQATDAGPKPPKAAMAEPGSSSPTPDIAEASQNGEGCDRTDHDCDSDGDSEETGEEDPEDQNPYPDRQEDENPDQENPPQRPGFRPNCEEQNERNEETINEATIFFLRRFLPFLQSLEQDLENVVDDFCNGDPVNGNCNVVESCELAIQENLCEEIQRYSHENQGPDAYLAFASFRLSECLQIEDFGFEEGSEIRLESLWSQPGHLSVSYRIIIGPNNRYHGILFPEGGGGEFVCDLGMELNEVHPDDEIYKSGSFFILCRDSDAHDLLNLTYKILPYRTDEGEVKMVIALDRNVGRNLCLLGIDPNDVMTSPSHSDGTRLLAYFIGNLDTNICQRL